MRLRGAVVGAAAVAACLLAGCEALLGLKHTGAEDQGGDATADLPDAMAVRPEGGTTSPEAGSCIEGAGRCAGNLTQVCSGGAWQDQAACTGTSPVCSNGTCGAFRVTGGIRSVGPLDSSDAGIRLVSGGFELGARACDPSGLCVMGGIVP